MWEHITGNRKASASLLLHCADDEQHRVVCSIKAINQWTPSKLTIATETGNDYCAFCVLTYCYAGLLSPYNINVRSTYVQKVEPRIYDLFPGGVLCRLLLRKNYWKIPYCTTDYRASTLLAVLFVPYVERWVLDQKSKCHFQSPSPLNNKNPQLTV